MARRVPRLDPARRVLHFEDRTVVVSRADPRASHVVVRSPAPADLARVLAAVDGVRSREEVCAALADAFDGDDVLAILDALEGVALLPDAAAPAPTAAPEVAVIGASALAIALAEALGGGAHVLWTGEAPPPPARSSIERVADAALWERAAGFPAVIAVHADATLAEAFARNAAAIAAGLTCLHVVSERDALVLGPAVVPGRTPCLECAHILWHFKGASGLGAGRALRGARVEPLADDADASVLYTLAARRLRQEVAGLVTGLPYPRLLSTMERLTLDGARVIELVPTTACESCGGAAPGGRVSATTSDATAAPPPLAAQPVADGEGGRAVDLAEAGRRVEAALARLGVDVEVRGYSAKLRRRYPELAEVPFVHARPRLTYRPDAPFVVGRVPDQCFGKGATPAQARTSALYELLERIMLTFRGGVPLVRARYRDVADVAIDMPAFTHGLLAIPDRGPRVPFDPAIEIDWVWGRCLRTGQPRLVPAVTVFPAMLGGERGPTLCSLRGAQIEMPLRGSSGLSAGATREDAVLQGLYEVIEHDARLLTQRAGIAAPRLDPRSIPDGEVRRLLDLVEAAGFDLQLRDLTGDIALPVAEAYATSRRDLTFHRLPGWGAHHDPAVAVRRAIAEALQCLGAAEAIRDQTFARGEFAITNTFHESRYAVDRVAGEVAFAALPPAPAGPRTALAHIAAAVAAIGAALPAAELIYVEYPTAGLEGVHVVAVVATQLINNLSLGHIVQDRLRTARLPAGAAPRPIADLYLGSLKT